MSSDESVPTQANTTRKRLDSGTTDQKTASSVKGGAPGGPLGFAVVKGYLK